MKNGVFDVCMKFLQQKETDPVIIALVVKWFMRLTNAQIEPQREMVEKVFHIYVGICFGLQVIETECPFLK